MIGPCFECGRERPVEPVSGGEYLCAGCIAKRKRGGGGGVWGGRFGTGDTRAEPGKATPFDFAAEPDKSSPAGTAPAPREDDNGGGS